MLTRAGMCVSFQRMDAPFLSIVVPVHNAKSRLSECLMSLLRQTYRPLEIICVDDGSEDNSLEILQKYALLDSRIKVIHQENAGVSAARNRGLDAATGEYVTFVDADDWVEPVAYEMAMSAFHQEVDMVCFGVVVDGEGESALEDGIWGGWCILFLLRRSNPQNIRDETKIIPLCAEYRLCHGKPGNRDSPRRGFIECI